MSSKALLILLLLINLIELSTQEYRVNGVGNTTITRAGGDMNRHHRYNLDVQKSAASPDLQHEGFYWKPFLIIGFMVIVSMIYCYGRKIYEVCRMAFFERTEKHYEKMDNISEV